MKRNMKSFLAVIGAAPLALLLLAWAGCATSRPRPGAGAPAGPVNLAEGATLWAQNCGHCHNIRSPSSYSDAQWEIVALHMRVRANLTAAEHRAILAFLKSAH